MIMQGTLVNVVAVVVGSLAGMSAGSRMPEQYRSIVLIALGLGTLLIGFKLALQTEHMSLVLGALLLGAITGTALNLEGALHRMAGKIKQLARQDSSTFVQGFVSASLLFCVGPMTIVGSIQDGATGDHTLLYTKSLLDLFAATALASSLGIGVLFSAITVLTVQGGLTLAGGYVAGITDGVIIQEMSAVGGLLIVAIGIHLLEIKALPLANLLPGLVFIIPLVTFFG
jgi:uncharacterized membrane protein YqgA involved in biofilm formation